MAIEIRAPREDELRAAMEASTNAFGSQVEEHDWEREQKILPASRSLAAYDDGRPVGFAAAYAFDLSIPGGELPCAGVTWVGVLPTHRRRGILRDFMRRQLEDVHGWAEPIAALWASEASIYGRFGYGLAAPGLLAKSNPRRFVLRDEPPSNVTVRLTDAEEAYGLFPPVYDRFRAGRAGRARSSTPSPRWAGTRRAIRPTGSRTSGRTASPRARSAWSSCSVLRRRWSSRSGGSCTGST